DGWIELRAELLVACTADTRAVDGELRDGLTLRGSSRPVSCGTRRGRRGVRPSPNRIACESAALDRFDPSPEGRTVRAGGSPRAGAGDGAEVGAGTGAGAGDGTAAGGGAGVGAGAGFGAGTGDAGGAPGVGAGGGTGIGTGAGAGAGAGEGAA